MTSLLTHCITPSPGHSWYVPTYLHHHDVYCTPTRHKGINHHADWTLNILPHKSYCQTYIPHCNQWGKYILWSQKSVGSICSYIVGSFSYQHSAPWPSQLCCLNSYVGSKRDEWSHFPKHHHCSCITDNKSRILSWMKNIYLHNDFFYSGLVYLMP